MLAPGDISDPLFCPCINHPSYSPKLRVSQLLLPQALAGEPTAGSIGHGSLPSTSFSSKRQPTALTCKGLVKKKQILCQKHEEQTDSLCYAEGKLPWYFHQKYEAITEWKILLPVIHEFKDIFSLGGRNAVHCVHCLAVFKWVFFINQY